MIIVLPEFYSKAKEQLDKVIDDIIRKNNIDWSFSHDSQAINDGKNMILNSLVRIYENVDVEGRKRLEEFEKDMKKIIKKENKNGKRRKDKKI